MLDYKETLAYAEFWRTDIAPYLRHLTTGSMGFTEYLQGFYKTLGPTHTFGIPLPYVYTLEWLKKFQDKCVTFVYNSPEEVAKGASILSGIYQLSLSLHAMANIHIWRDDGENDGHVTTFLIYENFDEVLQYAKDNLSLVKQAKPEQKGFAPPVFH